MTQPHDDLHNRDPYADDELVPFDVQGYSGNRGMWLLGIIFLLALIFAFVLFKIYQPGVRDRDQAPQITAAEAPDKVLVENAGSDGENQDLEIYNAMNGETNEGAVKVTESSEQPIKRPGEVQIEVTDRNAPKEPVIVAPAPVETAPKPVSSNPVGDSRYVVQLASLRSRASAEDTWKEISTKHAGVLPSGSYMNVVRADVPNKGTFYRLRLAGMADKATAERVCSRLKARNQSCFTTTK